LKIALVTTPGSSRSGIADYTRHLLPYLREGADVDVFVEVGRESEETGSVADLNPRDYDQILYQLGNEAQHAFMLPMIRAIGGTVVLHDWVLFDLAVAAYSSLERGGFFGHLRAVREGGPEEARIYGRSRRRGQRLPAGERFGPGWYAAEEGGRWSSARAELDLRASAALRLEFLVPKGRSATVGGSKKFGAGEHTFEMELSPKARGPLVFEVRGARAATDDARELGVFLLSIAHRVNGEWQRIKLDEPRRQENCGLSADRFELSFNRSVVRHADAFIVHSDSIGELVFESRNSPTPILRVHHGVERRWLDLSCESARSQLELPDSWSTSFVVASFGALQAHKRPGVLLEAISNLRARGVDAKLLCVGEERPLEFDFAACLAKLDLENHVHITGWLPEEKAWDALRAADICVNLRGPSTGGTSGGASQALSLGKPVVVSDLPEFAHLPEECVLRVAHGDREAENLAELLYGLARDPSRLAEMALKARQAVEEELHWSHVAKRYLEGFETFPRARASRRSLFVRFLHATAKDRVQIESNDAVDSRP
jgi:glycosyltransferase involved in cell wall biosynthesis